METRYRKNSMLYGALLLTAGSIALRLVQMLFQVYISGVMGATGLGRMQLITTVGGFGGVLASGGVRIAATCLAAEEAGRDDYGGLRRAVGCCMLYGLVLSLCVTAGMLLLAEFSARAFVEDGSAVLPLQILAVSLPINCLWSVMAGYFTATGRITELVGLEFFERLLSIGLVVLLLKTGLLSGDPCAAVLFGSAAATAVSFLLLAMRYGQAVRGIPPAPFRPMMKRLLALTLPLGFNDVLRSGLSAVENFLIPRGLRQSGSSGEDALSAYGTVCGMVFPVITFPMVILYSLSDLLVPEMARCRAKGRDERIRFLADKCLRLTVVFAVGAAGLCFSLGDSLGTLLFGSLDAGLYIRVFSPLILILYLDAITDGMLKGLSQQVYTARYNTITSLLDVGMLLFLLPKQGIGGFLAAFTVSHGLNFFLSMGRLIAATGYRPRFRTTILCCLSCIGAGALCGLLPAVPGALSAAGRGACFLSVYGLLILLTGAVTPMDLRWLRGLIRQDKIARNGT